MNFGILLLATSPLITIASGKDISDFHHKASDLTVYLLLQRDVNVLWLFSPRVYNKNESREQMSHTHSFAIFSEDAHWTPLVQPRGSENSENS